jgi:hypothetical protein
LSIKVKPWAEVVVDGKAVGRTPIKALALSPGPHTVVLTHPDYEPFRRVVTVRSGESLPLAFDLKDEALRKR